MKSKIQYRIDAIIEFCDSYTGTSIETKAWLDYAKQIAEGKTNGQQGPTGE